MYKISKQQGQIFLRKKNFPAENLCLYENGRPWSPAGWEILRSSLHCAGQSSPVPSLFPFPHQQNANESPHFTDEKTEAQRGNRIFPKLPDFIVLGLARDKGSLKQANTFGFFKLVFSKYLVNIYLEVRLGAAQRRMKKSDPGGCLSLSFTLAIPFWSQLA